MPSTAWPKDTVDHTYRSPGSRDAYYGIHPGAAVDGVKFDRLVRLVPTTEVAASLRGACGIIGMMVK
jgi:hypothetical protein